ncbi:MAG: class I SAM-dependent methyltransferase [Candidatus Omnitrophica bacterium]|nr:class I SAM-dependent methyltransferase [Candidatus Omnitrophota bacterium]MBU4487475.1 class I SAM-dependent methyltransferase [Candidatus Omnitrophota bacterium]MCG2705121.1 class I SAM-dependent methyltransferase [Candidatus Omnitrophota bacterium]
MDNDGYYGSEREDIIALIPMEAKRILDVGCGFGLMGKRIKEIRGPVEVVGFEAEEAALEMARKNLDVLIAGDVESVKLPFKDGHFDCIVYGEILEHLKDPWKVLKEHKRYLKKDGLCIASMPNISHYSVVQGLLNDRWDYKDSGILDRTHLRFFTIEGMRKMFSDAGYAISDEKRYIRASRVKKFLGKIFGKRAIHLLTEQYIITGKA